MLVGPCILLLNLSEHSNKDLKRNLFVQKTSRDSAESKIKSCKTWLQCCGIVQDARCVFCGGAPKDQDHLFVTCAYARQIWHYIQRFLRIHFMADSWEDLVGNLVHIACGFRKNVMYHECAVCNCGLHDLEGAQCSGVFC